MSDLRPLGGISTEATLAEVTNLLAEVCVRLADIADSVGNLSPDLLGRLRVSLEVGSAISATIGAVSYVHTVTNQAQFGTYAANQHMIALTQMAEQALRQNIVITP